MGISFSNCFERNLESSDQKPESKERNRLPLKSNPNK